MLRAGVLGCGDFAQRHATIAVGCADRVELVAFCDRNENKARAMKEKFAPSAAVFTKQCDLFAQAALDLVFICLPPYGHTDEVELAARHGVHFLIEKPIALNAEVAWRMVAIAEGAGLKTQVGFMNRFGGAVEAFRDLQQRDETGPIALMTGRYFCNALHSPWWRDREKSGGQLLEQVIHLLDLSRYLMGDPLTVFCRQANLFHRDVPAYTSEDVSTTLIQFESGGFAAISATNNAIPGKWISDYHVVAQRVTADFRSANEATFHFTGGSNLPPHEVKSARDFRREQLIDLLDAITYDRPTRTPIREGAKSLDLALAACRSAETKKEVEL
jgi:predicted dehydrogenase